jgi:C1A family cysteine protease
MKTWLLSLFCVLLMMISSEGFGALEPVLYSQTAYAVPHSKGLKRDAKKLSQFKKNLKHRFAKSTTSVPGKWDLTAKVSPPENQGQCGSCWDFSITKAMRSALMLVGKDPGVLAFNYLLNNCGGAASESGCGGGDFDAGKNMLNGKGPWLESQDHYTQSEGRCKSGLAVAGTALNWVLVGDGNSSPSYQLLAQASYNGGAGHMLSIDVDASGGSWESYSGGIYNRNGGSSIDHMINLVGYDCETSVDASGNCTFNSNGQPANGDGYLIVENNWGSSWGEAGYMRTRWGMNAIAETAMYFEVAAPPPPPVDGGYSDWSVCVNGLQSRTCTNPVPSNGGKDCSAIGPASQVCSVPPGPVPPSPEDGVPWYIWVLIVVAVLILVLEVVKVFQAKKALKP